MAKYFDPAFRVNVNGVGLAADISGHITQLKVIHEINTAHTFSFTLVNQYPEMRWTNKKDADLFRIGGAVVIEMGYVNSMQKLVQGEITKLEPSFPDSGGPTLGVEGQSLAYRLQRTKKTFNFVKKTDKEIAEELGQKASLKVEAEDSGAGQITRSSQQEMSAWDFLMARAGEIGFELLVEGKTLLYRKAKPESKAYSLEYGKTLKSFRATLDLKTQVNKVVVHGGHDADVKKIVGHAGPGDEDAGGGDKTAAQLAGQWFGSQEELQVSEPVANQQEADLRAKAIYNQKLRKACSGTASSIGIPDLRAGKVVELAGIGPLFSGLYKITQSTHTLNTSGYTTSFNVERWRF